MGLTHQSLKKKKERMQAQASHLKLQNHTLSMGPWNLHFAHLPLPPPSESCTLLCVCLRTTTLDSATVAKTFFQQNPGRICMWTKAHINCFLCERELESLA